MITILYKIQLHYGYLYIDGVRINNTGFNLPAPGADNNADIYIGKDNPIDFGGFRFQGKIDDIRIYNQVIGDDQIMQLYNATN